LEIRKNGIWEIEDDIPCGRSYDTFGVLAGVRNYVNTLPMAEPRGIPDDASRKIKKESDSTYYHSHSWLDVNDFLKHDWGYKSLDSRRSTIEKVTGREVAKSSYSAMWGTQVDKYDYVCLERTAMENLSKRWFEYFCKMIELAIIYNGLENVRIVFWFDN